MSVQSTSSMHACTFTATCVASFSSMLCNLAISICHVVGTFRLTSVNDNITARHPRGVALRAHEHSKVTNLLGLGESESSAFYTCTSRRTHRSKGVISCHLLAYALDRSSVCEVVISVATYLASQPTALLVRARHTREKYS